MTNDSAGHFKSREDLDPIINQLGEEILEVCREEGINIQEIIVASAKHDHIRRLISCKLVLVLEGKVPLGELEGQLYLRLNAPVPFDLILYSPAEWKELTGLSNTFAALVDEQGVRLLG